VGKWTSGRGDALIYHARDHNGLQEGGYQTADRVTQLVEACAVVVLDLPDTDKPRHTAPESFGAGGLFVSRDGAVVEGFVAEADDEDDVESDNGEYNPHSDAPLACPSDDEVTEDRRKVRSEEDTIGPDTDLAGMFVEEEYVLDTSQTDYLEGA